MITTSEKQKLVICQVGESASTSQQIPEIPGIQWLQVPGSYIFTESCYQVDYAAIIPESLCKNLPEHCLIDHDYDRVTKLELVGVGRNSIGELKIWFVNEHGGYLNCVSWQADRFGLLYVRHYAGRRMNRQGFSCKLFVRFFYRLVRKFFLSHDLKSILQK